MIKLIKGYIIIHAKTIFSIFLKETLNSKKSDLGTFDGFQTKPLWKLEILQKLLLLKVFFT